MHWSSKEYSSTPGLARRDSTDIGLQASGVTNKLPSDVLTQIPNEMSSWTPTCSSLGTDALDLALCSGNVALQAKAFEEVRATSSAQSTDASVTVSQSKQHYSRLVPNLFSINNNIIIRC